MELCEYAVIPTRCYTGPTAPTSLGKPRQAEAGPKAPLPTRRYCAHNLAGLLPPALAPGMHTVGSTSCTMCGIDASGIDVMIIIAYPWRHGAQRVQDMV